MWGPFYKSVPDSLQIDQDGYTACPHGIIKPFVKKEHGISKASVRGK